MPGTTSGGHVDEPLGRTLHTACLHQGSTTYPLTTPGPRAGNGWLTAAASWRDSHLLEHPAYLEPLDPRLTSWSQASSTFSAFAGAMIPPAFGSMSCMRRAIIAEWAEYTDTWIDGLTQTARQGGLLRATGRPLKLAPTSTAWQPTSPALTCSGVSGAGGLASQSLDTVRVRRQGRTQPNPAVRTRGGGPPESRGFDHLFVAAVNLCRGEDWRRSYHNTTAGAENARATLATICSRASRFRYGP